MSIFHPARWPMLSVTAAVVVIGAAIAAAASWGLGLLVFGAASAQEWLRPGTATGDEGWLAPVKVALTVAAGVGAAVALVVAYRKQHQAERQEQREIARHYQDRFDAAVEQMGSKSATVRLAGAYALAGLADQSPGQRQQCIEVLCAHLRLPWNLEDAGALTSVQVQQPFGNRGTRTATYTTTPGEEEVRKTILRIIGRHLAAGRRRVWVDSDATSDLAPPWSIQMLDLAGATLPDLTWEGVVLEDVDFHDARFVGRTRFIDVTFTGTARFSHASFDDHADFSGATFLGRANFFEARFHGSANFGLTRFMGAKSPDAVTAITHFGGAVFERHVSFIGAEFESPTWFGGAKFLAGGEAIPHKFR